MENTDKDKDKKFFDEQWNEISKSKHKQLEKEKKAAEEKAKKEEEKKQKALVQSETNKPKKTKQVEEVDPTKYFDNRKNWVMS